MTTKAWLTGHRFDLEELARAFPTGDTRVVAEGDEYYLTSRELDDAADCVDHPQVALRLLRRMNGIARLGRTDHRNVELHGRFSQPSGSNHTFVTVKEEIRIRDSATAVVTRANGEIVRPAPPPAPSGPAFLRTAAGHPDAREALDILGKPGSVDWVDLYKIFEIVRDAVKPTHLDRTAWVTKDDLHAFTGSANLPSVSGEQARHARMPGTPRRSMTIDQGREFIGRLMTGWLDSLR